MSRFDPFDREYAELRIESLRLKLEAQKGQTDLRSTKLNEKKESESRVANDYSDGLDDDDEDDLSDEEDEDHLSSNECVDEQDTNNDDADEEVSNDVESKMTTTTTTAEKISFKDLLKSYRESFCVVSQNDYPIYFKLRSSDLIRYFSVPICTRADGKSNCRLTNCGCMTSAEIGIKIYEKSGVHSFHQFANYIIGYVLEQTTDSLTRVAIEFNK